MIPFSDVLVVGAGPCGSYAAHILAKLGADVTVFEEHQEIGVPSHCAGHLSIKGLKNLGQWPLPKGIVENTFTGATFWSPAGKEFSVRFSSPVTCVVDRARFDKHVAETAQNAGAHYMLGHRVESLIVENGCAKGVVVKRNGQTERHGAKLVVDAEGISSHILRETGLRTVNPHKVVNAVQARVENAKDLKPDTVEVFLGKSYAPGLYAWLIPVGDREAKVGLAARTGNPRELLRKLMLKHPTASKKLANTRIVELAYHPITLGGPIPESYSDGFLAVGDVASHVKPTTGGGVVLGMTCARIIAEVASKALRANDFSSEFLHVYGERCDRLLDLDMKAMLVLRRLLDSMPDKAMDNMISICRETGLNKTLESVGEIDFQGRPLLRMLRNPRAITAFACLLYLFFCESLKSLNKQTR